MDDLRKRWRQYWVDVDRYRRVRDRIEEESPGRHLGPFCDPPALPEYPTFPEELAELTCGAKTRAGTPCKRRDLYENGRCRLHGGPSTGPRTKRGKRKSAKNGLKPKRTP